jgi:proteasome beta subunit
MLGVSMAQQEEITGATVVGLTFNDGVIIAAEKRVTLGPSLMSRGGKKIFKITNKIFIGVAGIIADMQAISKTLSAELKLYELTNKREPSTKAAAKLLSNILYSNKLFPYYTSIIVGGVDATGPHIYVLDPLGSLIEDKYATLGTGAELAISVIEGSYKENMSREEAENLAYKSIKLACERDVLSGDGIDLVVITKNGVEEKFIPIK